MMKLAVFIVGVLQGCSIATQPGDTLQTAIRNEGLYDRNYHDGKSMWCYWGGVPALKIGCFKKDDGGTWTCTEFHYEWSRMGGGFK